MRVWRRRCAFPAQRGESEQGSKSRRNTHIVFATFGDEVDAQRRLFDALEEVGMQACDRKLGGRATPRKEVAPALVLRHEARGVHRRKLEAVLWVL